MIFSLKALAALRSSQAQALPQQITMKKPEQPHWPSYLKGRGKAMQRPVSDPRAIRRNTRQH